VVFNDLELATRVFCSDRTSEIEGYDGAEVYLKITFEEMGEKGD
jgi:hypothetical protein